MDNYEIEPRYVKNIATEVGNDYCLMAWVSALSDQNSSWLLQAQLVNMPKILVSKDF